ncbi:MAG: DUF4178 domain-containing protein [Clostridiales bacterium]|nr:DUF4178 domain-containing protein [Clostridiales bacterium]
MMSKNLVFQLGDKILVCNNEYTVSGIITYCNDADGYEYDEYKIINNKNGKIQWLSIDTTYEEYGLYTESKTKLKTDGYSEKDYGIARVVKYKGNVDVDINEKVNFTEYEDITESKIISIEKWDDEIEYSTGIYIDKEDIRFLNNFNDYNRNEEKEKYGFRKVHLFIIAIILVLIVIVSYTKISGNKTKIYNFLNSNNSSYSYTTSITSDLNSKEKANVYSTELSIEEASKAIIKGIDGDIKDVQENQVDKSVALLTDNEYCIVYKDIENKTLIHQSSRKYAYSSTNTLYNSTEETDNYYRNYYYNYALKEDEKKYNSSTNGYRTGRHYTSPILSSNNSYDDYSKSVRQSSTSSRTSSGGGTSSGK